MFFVFVFKVVNKIEKKSKGKKYESHFVKCLFLNKM